MEITTEAVKELRDKTGISVMECKKALTEADGDMEKAMEVLKTRSAAMVAKKSDRELAAGTVVSYIHNAGQVGAMVVLCSETDFVSKNPEFEALARDIAMHVAAMRSESVEALVSETFIKDPSKTIAELLAGATQKFGERVEVSKISCLAVH
ncbi:translation elongation factor Ts [Patescibacteria group bacterium]|nr:translation elongation factor Ts [Patescibacteria group bacterium]